MGVALNPGYIYILQNESLDPDRLKIGRTVHNPESRAEEISQATGVPTPFTVSWYGYTEDCIIAERLIHESLDDYRTNPKREFFDVDLDEAIAAGRIAAKEAGPRRSWFYRPDELWNIDPRHPLSFAGFLFHRILRPIARAPVNLVLLVLYLASLLVKILWLALVFSLSLFVRVIGLIFTGILKTLTGR
tara:strand:+ start:1800 stop:2366 length:567 start_codon:yes stop_codon:yes gene_type:complete